VSTEKCSTWKQFRVRSVHCGISAVKKDRSDKVDKGRAFGCAGGTRSRGNRDRTSAGHIRCRAADRIHVPARLAQCVCTVAPLRTAFGKRDGSDKVKVKEDEIGLGIADARLRVGGRRRLLIRQETNRSASNQEGFGETKGTSAVSKGQLFGETKGHKRLKGRRGSLMSVRPQMHTTKDKSVSKV
jgi:hypothetical protein